MVTMEEIGWHRLKIKTSQNSGVRPRMWLSGKWLIYISESLVLISGCIKTNNKHSEGLGDMIKTR